MFESSRFSCIIKCCSADLSYINAWLVENVKLKCLLTLDASISLSKRFNMGSSEVDPGTAPTK